MRYLKPRKFPVIVGEKVYHVIFTLDVIDELQVNTQMPITKLIMLTRNEKTKELAIRCLLKSLIPDTEVNIKENELEYLATSLLTAFFEQTKSKEIEGQAKPTQSNEEEDESYIDVEMWVFFGTVILKYPENEVWQMTLGKIGTLYKENLKYIGAIKDNREVDIDDVM